MKLGRHSTCCQIQHQGHCCCMQWGPTKVDSDSTSVLPLSSDSPVVLKGIIQNTNRATKGHPSIGTVHDFCSTEHLTRASLHLIGWRFVVNRACCSDCTRPKMRIDSFFPSMLSMTKASLSCFLQFPNAPLSHSRLEVCIDS
jgi:hypothetical protein